MGKPTTMIPLTGELSLAVQRLAKCDYGDVYLVNCHRNTGTGIPCANGRACILRMLPSQCAPAITDTSYCAIRQAVANLPSKKPSPWEQLAQCASDVSNGTRELKPVNPATAIQAGLASVPKGAVIGAVRGAIIGAFFGGAGAGPGAAAGAAKGGVGGFLTGAATSALMQACGVR
jgi:hypothetical protein